MTAMYYLMKRFGKQNGPISFSGLISVRTSSLYFYEWYTIQAKEEKVLFDPRYIFYVDELARFAQM